MATVAANRLPRVESSGSQQQFRRRPDSSSLLAKHQYWTGLLESDDRGFFARRCTGAGWEAVIRPAPGRRNREGGIFILAKSKIGAQRALDLIWTALPIVASGPWTFENYPVVRRMDSSGKLEPYDPEFLGRDWTFSSSDIPFACFVAARASRKRDFTYALVALAFSQTVAAVHFMDLEPHRSPYWPVSTSPIEHVRFGYAIIAAYAAIEQLGLEVRASSSRPSFVNGAWNPVVREDLERRLVAAGVDLTETALWDVRGPLRRIERIRRPRARARANWAWGPVRDIEVDLVDAIADASWLRSKVSAHRLDELTTSLAIYDVANCQYLARRLLLTSLGLWRILDDPFEDGA